MTMQYRHYRYDSGRTLDYIVNYTTQFLYSFLLGSAEGYSQFGVLDGDTLFSHFSLGLVEHRSQFFVVLLKFLL